MELDVYHRPNLERAHKVLAQLVFRAIKLDQLKFRITGDFSFFMPCLGLLKGCGSGNPCPLCDQERSKCGGGAAKWVEGADVNLRSFGSLMYNYAGWVLEGEHSQAIKTKTTYTFP